MQIPDDHGEGERGHAAQADTAPGVVAGPAAPLGAGRGHEGDHVALAVMARHHQRIAVQGVPLESEDVGLEVIHLRQFPEVHQRDVVLLARLVAAVGKQLVEGLGQPVQLVGLPVFGVGDQLDVLLQQALVLLVIGVVDGQPLEQFAGLFADDVIQLLGAGQGDQFLEGARPAPLGRLPLEAHLGLGVAG